MGELNEHFRCFGPILKIEIKKDLANTYAFCEYTNIRSVVKAIDAMNGKVVAKNRIRLKFGKTKFTYCIWISNFSDDVSQIRLQKYFSQFGTVKKISVHQIHKVALILFNQMYDAQMAIRAARTSTLLGQNLEVDFASDVCQKYFEGNQYSDNDNIAFIPQKSNNGSEPFARTKRIIFIDGSNVAIE